MSDDIARAITLAVTDRQSAVDVLRGRLAHDWTDVIPPELRDMYERDWAEAFVGRLVRLVAQGFLGAGDLLDVCLCHCATLHPRSLGICTGTAEDLIVRDIAGQRLPACLACWHAASGDGTGRALWAHGAEGDADA